MKVWLAMPTQAVDMQVTLASDCPIQQVGTHSDSDYF